MLFGQSEMDLLGPTTGRRVRRRHSRLGSQDESAVQAAHMEHGRGADRARCIRVGHRTAGGRQPRHGFSRPQLGGQAEVDGAAMRDDCTLRRSGGAAREEDDVRIILLDLYLRQGRTRPRISNRSKSPSNGPPAGHEGIKPRTRPKRWSSPRRSLGSVSRIIRAISGPVHQPFNATVTAPSAVAAQNDKTYSTRLAAATATRSPLPMPYALRNA